MHESESSRSIPYKIGQKKKYLIFNPRILYFYLYGFNVIDTKLLSVHFVTYFTGKNQKQIDHTLEDRTDPKYKQNELHINNVRHD